MSEIKNVQVSPYSQVLSMNGVSKLSLAIQGIDGIEGIEVVEMPLRRRNSTLTPVLR